MNRRDFLLSTAATALAPALPKVASTFTIGLETHTYIDLNAFISLDAAPAFMPFASLMSKISGGSVSGTLCFRSDEIIAPWEDSEMDEIAPA